MVLNINSSLIKFAVLNIFPYKFAKLKKIKIVKKSYDHALFIQLNH